MNKTIEELENEIKLREELEKERQISNQLYAIKLAEKIIFSLVGLICISVVGALIGLVLLQK
jgi:hypothetical protein